MPLPRRHFLALSFPPHHSRSLQLTPCPLHANLISRHIVQPQPKSSALPEPACSLLLHCSLHRRPPACPLAHLLQLPACCKFKDDSQGCKLPNSPVCPHAAPACPPYSSALPPASVKTPQCCKFLNGCLLLLIFACLPTCHTCLPFMLLLSSSSAVCALFPLSRTFGCHWCQDPVSVKSLQSAHLVSSVACVIRIPN